MTRRLDGCAGHGRRPSESLILHIESTRHEVSLLEWQGNVARLHSRQP